MPSPIPLCPKHLDIHWVTKWSKLDTHWEGVSLNTLLELVQPNPEAKFVSAFCYGGYMTNLALSNPTRLLYSIRTPADLIYGQELARLEAQDANLQLIYTYTRQAPAQWNGYTRRIDRDMLAENLIREDPHHPVYVCAPTQLVETVADSLVSLNLPPEKIFTERFGSTGNP